RRPFGGRDRGRSQPAGSRSVPSPPVTEGKGVLAARNFALDGLRGLAVAAVVVYHVWPDWLPGGFLGVSVFFTLSGFLITTLLLDEWLRDGSVDARRFWSRRARRLLPAA